jgi:hypothetical protein
MNDEARGENKHHVRIAREGETAAEDPNQAQKGLAAQIQARPFVAAEHKDDIARDSSLRSQLTAHG